jgi:hypothetical protein
LWKRGKSLNQGDEGRKPTANIIDEENCTERERERERERDTKNPQTYIGESKKRQFDTVKCQCRFL